MRGHPTRMLPEVPTEEHSCWHDPLIIQLTLGTEVLRGVAADFGLSEYYSQWLVDQFGTGKT